MDIGAAARGLATELTEVDGVPTSVDGGALTVPGGWLTVAEVNPDRLDPSTCEVLFTLYLVTTDSDTATALDTLGWLLAKVAHRVGTDTPVVPVNLSMPNYSSTPLPALSVPIPTEVTT